MYVILIFIVQNGSLSNALVLFHSWQLSYWGKQQLSCTARYQWSTFHCFFPIFFYTIIRPVSSHNRNETNKWMEHRQTSLIPNKLMIQKAIIMFFPCITFNHFHCNLRQNSSQQHLDYPVFYLPSNFENHIITLFDTP